MRQFLSSVAVVLLLAAGSTNGDPPKAPELRGTWVAEMVEYSGNKMATKYVFEFADGKLTRKTSPTSKVSTPFKYHLNATTNPMEIELVPTTAAKVEKVQKGIFHLEGDQLKICIQGTTIKAANKPRPTQFATKAGDGNYLYILKRQK